MALVTGVYLNFIVIVSRMGFLLFERLLFGVCWRLSELVLIKKYRLAM